MLISKQPSNNILKIPQGSIEYFQYRFQSHSIFSLQLIRISRTWKCVISTIVFHLISKSKWKVNIDYNLLIKRGDSPRKTDSSGIDFQRCFTLSYATKITSAISVFRRLFMDKKYSDDINNRSRRTCCETTF